MQDLCRLPPGSSQTLALLWDVDGTLAETERDGLRVAFNQAFEALGMPRRWDEAYYGTLLRIAGGLERIRFDMANRSQSPKALDPLAPGDVLALEDSHAGVAAARAAGIPVVRTRSVYLAAAATDGALAAGPGLQVREGWEPPPRRRAGAPGITLDDLLEWRRRGAAQEAPHGSRFR